MISGVYSDNQIDRNEMGACSTYGEKKGCIQNFGGETLGEGDHLRDPDVDGRIILNWIFKKWDGAWTGLS
jgi:hypothetical protein